MSVIKLYELAEYYSKALERLSEAESIEEQNEGAEAIYDELDAIDVSVQEKVESIGDIVMNYEATADALKAEAKRLTERAANATKAAENLKSYVETVMKKNDFTELKGLKHTFSFTTSTSLVCKDASLLPKQFQKISVSADVSGMKKHLKQKYDENNIKLVNKPSAKPKGKELLYTDLNESIRDMGLEYIINTKLKMK